MPSCPYVCSDLVSGLLFTWPAALPCYIALVADGVNTNFCPPQPESRYVSFDSFLPPFNV